MYVNKAGENRKVSLKSLTLFRMGLFGAAHEWGAQKGPPSQKSVIQILQWWNLAQLYFTWRRYKIYINVVTPTLNSTGTRAFFH